MRKLTLSSMVLVLVTCGWGDGSFGQEVSAPQGEVRIVDATPFNWLSVTFNVMEHLIELKADGTPVPRLATGWRWLNDRTLEITLRQGVTFHNGEIFDAEHVKLNWEAYFRLKQPVGLGTMMNYHPGSRLEIIDPYTVRFVLPEPDGGVLAKLSYLHIANRQFYREFGWGEKHW